MDSLAILLGFKYSGSRILPYVDRDLDMMSKFATHSGFPVETITDFTMDIRLYAEDMLEGLHGYQFISLADLLFRLQQLIYGKKKILFYYSGHSEDNSLILPSGEHLDSRILTSLLTQDSPNILAFFDCCYGVGLSLPFVLKDGKMRYTGEVMVSGKVISINGTSKDKRAEMDSFGSSFTYRISNEPAFRKKVICLSSLGFLTMTSSSPDGEFSF